MSTMTAERSLRAVQSSAEKIRSNQPQRFPEAASPGDVFRQGDVYVELLDRLPAGVKFVKNPSPQLAPGTTQGSRHVLDSLDGVQVYALDGADVLTGPVIHCREERTITHPEHGHVILPPGVYGITYQRAFADELRRAAD